MVDSVPSGIVAVNQTQGSIRNSSKGHKRYHLALCHTPWPLGTLHACLGFSLA